jgi:hypothetical protein
VNYKIILINDIVPMTKEVFYNLNQLHTHCNVYIKNTTIDDMHKRTREYKKINPDHGALMLCDFVKDDVNIYNKKYIHRYGDLSNLYELDTDTLDIIKVDINTDMLKSEQMTLMYDNNIKHYMGVVGDSTTDKCDKARNMTILTYNDGLLMTDVKIKPPARASLFKVVSDKNNYFMKINGQVHKLSKLYDVHITIDTLNSEKKITRSPKYQFRMYVTDSSPNVKFVGYVINDKQVPTLNIEHNGKIKPVVLPCTLTDIIIDVHFEYELKLDILELVDESKYISSLEFDKRAPCTLNNILKKMYESLYNCPMDFLPIEVMGDADNTMYAAACNKFLYVNRPYILSNIFAEFPEKYSNTILFKKDTSSGYFMYPFGLIAGKSNDSAPTMVFHNNQYFFYERGNPLPGARNIEVSTSFDMKEWSNLELITINKSHDISDDNYYTPNVMSLRDTKYIILLTPYYSRNRITQQFHRLLLSKNGKDFDIVGNVNNMDHSKDHHDYAVVSNGIIIDNNCTKMYFSDDTHLIEYSTEPYGLFYLTTDNLGTFETKILKIKNNSFSFGYKCLSKDNSHMHITILDPYNNIMKKDIPYFIHDTYTVKTISWKVDDPKNNVDYIKLQIELKNANLYWIEGEFVDEINDGFSHIIYKVNDYVTSWFDKAGEGYHNINILKEFGFKAKCIVGKVRYNIEHTHAYLSLQLMNNEIIDLFLWNAEDDIMIKLNEYIVPFELKNIDPEDKIRKIINTVEGRKIIENTFSRKNMIEDNMIPLEIEEFNTTGKPNSVSEKDTLAAIKIVPLVYKRSVCVFDYRLIDLPRDCK